jgi:hypothetical protein
MTGTGHAAWGTDTTTCSFKFTDEPRSVRAVAILFLARAASFEHRAAIR